GPFRLGASYAVHFRASRGPAEESRYRKSLLRSALQGSCQTVRKAARICTEGLEEEDPQPNETTTQSGALQDTESGAPKERSTGPIRASHPNRVRQLECQTRRNREVAHALQTDTARDCE